MSGSTPARRWGPASWAALVVGAALGVALDWLVIGVGALTAYMAFGDEQGVGGSAILVAGFVLLPLLTVWAVAGRERRTPFLIGLAAGAIVGSGVCAGLWAGGGL